MDIPIRKNPNPLNEEHIIDFVRKRNHGSKHLDLFPRDIDDIKRTGYGRAIMGGQSYVFDVVLEDGVDTMRIYLGDARNPNIILPLINSFVIQPGYAYVLYTTALTNTYVYCGILTVPELTSMATGWALGLVAKNKMTPTSVRSLYTANKDNYDRIHAENPLLPEAAHKPHYRKFSNWLCGTWCSDRNGNAMNAKISWGMSNYEPTYQEAIEFLQDMHTQCTTISAKSRIEYVLMELNRRKEANDEDLV